VSDKRISLDDAVAEVRSGMTIGIGGWGSRRKPMAFVRALLRTDVKDLTVVTYGGPDLGLLCSAGKVKRAYYGFVSLDSPPFYDPWFAKARASGALEAREMDEGMLRCGLQAAAQRLPFLPIRAGLGSSVLDFWEGELKTVTSPYPAPGGGHETLLAMPALNLDAAFVHLNLGDERGNAAYTGIDPYFDDLFLMAAERRYLSVERIVTTDELIKAVPPQEQANVRNDMYVASEALRMMIKANNPAFNTEETTALNSYKSKVDNATKFIPSWVKVAVALALGLGTMVGWKRVVVTVGERIGKDHLTHAQGASAGLVAMGTIFAADKFGLPVSTTHILSSGVAGTMAANGNGLRFSTIRNIAAGWVFTLPAAALLSGILY